MSKYFIAIPTNNVKTRFKDEDNHLTITYLGNKKELEAKKILNKVNEKNFILESEGYSRFGNKYPHLSFKKNNRLERIYNNLKKYSPSNKEFSPHVTLAVKMKKLPRNSKTTELKVNRVSLYKIKNNVDNKNSSKYEIVDSIKLKRRNMLDKILDWFKNLG